MMPTPFPSGNTVYSTSLLNNSFAFTALSTNGAHAPVASDGSSKRLFTPRALSQSLYPLSFSTTFLFFMSMS